MYDDDDLIPLDLEAELADPLDRFEVASDAPESPLPDPAAMLALLSSSVTQQRMLAARAFCEIQDQRAVPLLVTLLQDDCPLVRVSAAYALGRNGDPSILTPEEQSTILAPLIQQLQDWNGYVRKGVIWALGNTKSTAAIPPLIEALKTDIPAVRLWAASALAQMVSVDYEAIVVAIPPLIEVMRRDAIPAVRSNCAWSLGQLCKELPSNVVYATAIDALIEAFAEEKDLGVREDARTAILRVGDTRGLQVIEELEQDGWF
ncbi:HEAT repeat domain-containing protein [Leptolyngbya sp. PCC 6406]|uniref:HEAT repeat domain-containing protein n=1 Tax=Leptolyngbya sp. PCC 6406 TaxID=1173264 RepID=UPI0002ACC183|nr:HEAT repeat domain-containing protein [Leptolyngbya sp. PCC 6406]